MNNYSSYSVAIRTLGKSPETLKRELISLHNQTVSPEKIIVYIARGYDKPDFHIGCEEYVEVNKGMVSQRALPYDEISSELILLLDDDVELERNCMEKALMYMTLHKADCIAFDTFENHKMSLKSKIKAAVTGLTFPRLDKRWAFKLHANDSFSYINFPGRGCYPSMSAAGPASLWKKSSLRAMRFEDEVWMDRLGFPYGEDALEFYKLYLNGGKLMVAFEIGVKNLDAKTSSSIYLKSAERFRTMAKAMTIKWHRMHYAPSSGLPALISLISFNCKIAWQSILMILLSIRPTQRTAASNYFKGVVDGWRFIRSEEYRSIPSYLID